LLEIHQTRMDETKCHAFKQDSTKCTLKHTRDSLYCKRHEKTIYDYGPHRFARDQLAHKQNFERRQQIDEYRELTSRPGITQEERNQLYDQRTIQEAELTVRHNQEIRALNRVQEEEIRTLGYNPDSPAHNRIRMGEIERSLNRYQSQLQLGLPPIDVEAQIEGIMRFTNVLQEDLREEQHDEVFRERLRISIALAQTLTEGYLQQIGNPIPVNGTIVRHQETQLAKITKDSQNVHTTVVVETVKSNIKFLFEKIEVPPEYQWNMTKTSYTFRDITYSLNMSPKTLKHFANMYLSDDMIYEYQKGIYGMTIDRVWQFIVKSEHRLDLMKILRNELNDNVGMCAQGNLSRIVNVLCGYLEGLKQEETTAEILGREFPKLMEIEDKETRLEKGKELLASNKVPEQNWNEWLEALS